MSTTRINEFTKLLSSINSSGEDSIEETIIPMGDDSKYDIIIVIYH